MLSLRLYSLVLTFAVLAPHAVHADLVLRPQLQNLSGPTASAATSPFDIQVSFLSSGPNCKGGITPSAQHLAAFATAEATWESLVTGYKEEVSTNTLSISVCIGSIDEPGGILGSAGPTTGKGGTSTYLYANDGEMTFDKLDIDGLGTALDAVILHEMAHVMGLGTLWSSDAVGVPGFQELYVDDSGEYTGAAGLSAYKSEFDQPSATFVPVELEGGGGTANGHWNETAGGAAPTGIVSNISGQDMQFELMTGWLNSPTFISALTIQQFADIGYSVSAIPEPSAFLFLSLVGCIGLFRLIKKRGTQH